MKKEIKNFSGRVVETKQEDRNGVPVGIVSGYIATFDTDRGDDRFIKGAFLDSIKDHMDRDRPVRFKDQHWALIGGFPVEGVFEDDKGLFATGEINLNVRQGHEVFALAKQGVLSDFSIGFTSESDEMEDGVRLIKQATIWEGSIVEEPMNPEAVITEIKSLTIEDIKNLNVGELENALMESGALCKHAAKFLVDRLKPEVETRDIIAILNSIKALL